MQQCVWRAAQRRHISWANEAKRSTTLTGKKLCCVLVSIRCLCFLNLDGLERRKQTDRTPDVLICTALSVMLPVHVPSYVIIAACMSASGIQLVGRGVHSIPLIIECHESNVALKVRVQPSPESVTWKFASMPPATCSAVRHCRVKSPAACGTMSAVCMSPAMLMRALERRPCSVQSSAFSPSYISLLHAHLVCGGPPGPSFCCVLPATGNISTDQNPKAARVVSCCSGKKRKDQPWIPPLFLSFHACKAL